MQKFICLSILGAIGLAQATLVNPPYSVFDKLEGLPRGWQLYREANYDEPIVLHVSLPNQNVEEFYQQVIEISTPSHPSYGQHLEGHEVKGILRPIAGARDAVIDWLKDYNITSVVIDDEYVTFHTSVEVASNLLKTKFFWFKNYERDETELRTLEYSLPNYLSDYVDFVHPTIKFPSVRDLGSTLHLLGKPKTDLVDVDVSAISDYKYHCDEYIRPKCLFQLYNIHYGADAKNGNRMSYASFTGQSARYRDLANFENGIARYAIGQNFTVHAFPPAKNNQARKNDDEALEANLDNQYSVAMSYPTPVEEFITAGCGPCVSGHCECINEPYMQFLKNILALPNSKLPQTLSISYGDDEQTWPRAIAQKVCRGFAQLGARGVSVLFASGDSGPGYVCENNSGTKKQFVPVFPATCPFVTAVGATKNLAPEEATIFSSGGFSNYFARPKFQDKVVSVYLAQLGSKFKPYYNASGRGFPDVAAQGKNYLVYSGGNGVTAEGGTSASSPTFASVISLLNSALISSGKKPLGYLNPFLYSSGAAGLTDITTGRSVGCKLGKMTIKHAGWEAVKGWDAVTGLGTPDFGKLLGIVAPGVKNTGGPMGKKNSS